MGVNIRGVAEEFVHLIFVSKLLEKSNRIRAILEFFLILEIQNECPTDL